MSWKLFVCIITIACIHACNPDPVNYPFPDTSLEYFPLKIGSSITYQVDSIIFDDAPGGNKLDTVSFQLREEIVSKNVTEAGDTLYYIHRFRRSDETQSWLQTDVWTTSISSAEALRTEENLKFRKLSFPLRFGKRWYSTAHIDPETLVLIGTENVEAYQDWEAEVISYDKSAVVGDFQFSDGKAMVVDQTNTDDGTMRRFVRETYVRNIGVVEKRDSILDSRCIDLGDFGPCIGKPWVEHANKGYILSQVMIAYE